MLGIGIFDTLALYIFAAIGIKVVVTNLYEYFLFVLCLMDQNVKYYFPRLYLSVSEVQNRFRKYLGLSRWTKDQLLSWKLSRWELNQMNTSVDMNKRKDKGELEAEVMDDILSKSKTYYDSMKEIFESKIKDVSDPQLKNTIEQWYQKMTSIEDTSSFNMKDFTKKMNECAGELFQLMENYR